MAECLGCSRRVVLITLLLSSSHALAKCGNGLDVGAAKSHPVGTFRLIEADMGRFIVARDAAGFYAYSAMCTHMGGAIVLSDANGTSTCPSHQSMFGPHGEVLRGPATRPLPHFAVTLCEGRVFLDPFTIVTADARS